jgi:hypothetical protein
MGVRADSIVDVFNGFEMLEVEIRQALRVSDDPLPAHTFTSC